ncbi:MAG: PilZ domain-containing protein [Acidimicrobiales bacterium]
MDRREIYSLTGSIVRIATPGGGQVVLFSVESAASTMAVLRPCNSASKEFARTLSPGDVLHLTAGASDGVLHGTLKVERWSPAQRMLIVDNPPLEYTQRRESFRVAGTLPVDLLLRDPDDPSSTVLVRGTTRDLSLGGLSFTLPDGALPPAGHECLLVLHTETRPIIVVVEIMGAHPDARAAHRARFVQVNPFEQTVLAAQVRRLEVAKVATSRNVMTVG